MPNEWQISTDPDLVLMGLDGRVETPVLRAFAIACCRRILPQLEGEARAAIEVAARFADGRATTEELDAARRAFGSLTANEAAQAAWYCVWRDALIAARNAAWYAAAAAVGRHAPRSRWEAERAAQAALLREMAGDRFATAG
jgi:hypothetical protein